MTTAPPQAHPRALVFCRADERREALVASAVRRGLEPLPASLPLDAVFAVERPDVDLVVIAADPDDVDGPQTAAAFVEMILEDALATDVLVDASLAALLPAAIRARVRPLLVDNSLSGAIPRA